MGIMNTFQCTVIDLSCHQSVYQYVLLLMSVHCVCHNSLFHLLQDMDVGNCLQTVIWFANTTYEAKHVGAMFFVV